MKQFTALKLTCVGAFVASLGVGCASSGYARYDADQTDMDQGVGVSASTDVGTDRSATINTGSNIRTDSSATIQADVDTPNIRTDVDSNNIRTDIDSPSVRTDIDTDRSYSSSMDLDDNDRLMVDETEEGAARVTVSALSLTPETRATWVNRFPFYDQNWKLRSIDVYTFAVPDPNADIAVSTRASTDAPQFSADLPPGSVFVEAAGGVGEVETGRVIQHSPNPVR
jgi:hypothetical protein